MRTCVRCTRWLLLFSVVSGHIGAGEPASRPADPGEVLKRCQSDLDAQRWDAADRASSAALEAFPESVDLWLVRVDVALRQGHWATALERVVAAETRLGVQPALDMRAGQAYFGLDRLLGSVAVRNVSDGRVGQIRPGWLLLEQRGAGRFLCCSEDSALYRVRRALAGGAADVAVDVLHARIWQSLGKPEAGLALLRVREAELLAAADSSALEVAMELALAAGEPEAYLRYARARAELAGDRRDELLGEAYGALAEYYGRLGDTALHREFGERAVRLRPDQPELLLGLGDAAWLAGQRAEAARHYRELLKRAPDHRESGRARERLADWERAGRPEP